MWNGACWRGARSGPDSDQARERVHCAGQGAVEGLAQSGESPISS